MGKISLFKVPPIAINCPEKWIDEAIEFEEWYSANSEKYLSYLKGYYSARRLAKRAFALYYDQTEQFDKFYKDWEEDKNRTDFVITKNKVRYRFDLTCIPVKDWNPKIGHTFNCKYFRNTKLEGDISHLFCSWWCPIIFINGWVNDKDINQKGVTEITQDKLKSMKSHLILDSLDTRKTYI